MPARERARPDVDDRPEGADREGAPAPPAPAALSRASVPEVLRFATAFGNRATVQALQRQPVASAADVAAKSPSGPLAKLRDELDDTFVDEDACLEWLGQLGPGERTLVGRDTTMMGQMVDAFNVSEMLRAVEFLELAVAWQLYWIDRAGDAEDIGQPAFARLLNSAKADDFNQLVSSDAQLKVAACYKGDVLSLATVAGDPARTAGWLARAPFVDWVLKRSGAPALMGWVAANGTAAAVASLKAADRWNALLDKLRGDGPAGLEREALFKVFMAATVADDRRRLYELRFGRRAEGTFDWIAEGEAEWKRQESFAGAGRTREQIEKEVAAGGPKTAADAAKADDKGSLAKLRDELDDTFVDEDACLRWLGELNDRELYLVGEDGRMLEQMGDAFNASEMRQALNRLRFLSLKAALKFIADSGETKDLAATMYQQLVNRASAQEIAEAIGWEETMNVLKTGSHVNPLAMQPLVADDAKMAHVIATYGHFTRWVLDFRGGSVAGAPAFVRYLAAHSPLQTFMALKTAGRMNEVLDALPTGSSLATLDKLALKTICLALTDVPTKKLLLMKRFNLERIEPDKEAQYAPAAGTDFEAPVLDRIWELLELLPPADVADNKWLEAITRRSNPSGPDPQGVTPDNRVAIGYDPTQMGRLETGLLHRSGRRHARHQHVRFQPDPRDRPCERRAVRLDEGRRAIRHQRRPRRLEGPPQGHRRARRPLGDRPQSRDRAARGDGAGRRHPGAEVGREQQEDQRRGRLQGTGRRRRRAGVRDRRRHVAAAVGQGLGARDRAGLPDVAGVQQSLDDAAAGCQRPHLPRHRLQLLGVL